MRCPTSRKAMGLCLRACGVSSSMHFDSARTMIELSLAVYSQAVTQIVRAYAWSEAEASFSDSKLVSRRAQLNALTAASRSTITAK